MINPLSGRTLNEEIIIARAIGGRLPFEAYQASLRHGKLKKRRHDAKAAGGAERFNDTELNPRNKKSA